MFLKVVKGGPQSDQFQNSKSILGKKCIFLRRDSKEEREVARGRRRGRLQASGVATEKGHILKRKQELFGQ